MKVRWLLSLVPNDVAAADFRTAHGALFPASSRAVAIHGMRWDGEDTSAELIDWDEVVFELWRAGIFVPGPTSGGVSI